MKTQDIVYLELGAFSASGAEALPPTEQEECGAQTAEFAMNTCKHKPDTVFLLCIKNPRRATTSITAIRTNTRVNRPPMTPPTTLPTMVPAIAHQ